jgi:hypothetical protein
LSTSLTGVTGLPAQAIILTDAAQAASCADFHCAFGVFGLEVCFAGS